MYFNPKKIIIVGVCALVFWFFVYPMILLLFFNPWPETVNRRNKSGLGIVWPLLKGYAKDNNMKIEKSLTDISQAFPILKPYTNITLSALQFFPEENEDKFLLAYSKSCLPRAIPPPFFPQEIRGWPTNIIPARRFLLFSDGNIEMIKETDFNAFMLKENKKIKEWNSLQTKMRSGKYMLRSKL